MPSFPKYFTQTSPSHRHLPLVGLIQKCLQCDGARHPPRAQTPGFTDEVLGWKRTIQVTSGLRLQGNAAPGGGNSHILSQVTGEC